jgi:thiol:disulfide interchange protein DsbD
MNLHLLQQDNIWLVLASFFGFGLLLALTPCVFPMIPILSGIIVGQKGTMTGYQYPRRLK